MHKFLRFFLTLGVIAAILLLILWQGGTFARNRIEPGAVPATVPPVKGTEIHLTPSAVPVIYRAVGTVRSREEIELSPRIVSRVREVTRRSGDTIKRGEVLVRLDDADLTAARDRAAQNLAEAKAAQDRAEKNYVRQKGLLAKNIIPRKDFENAEEDWRASTARVNATEQSLKEAETALTYATITSPMDAVVAERFVDPGDLAGQSNVMLKLFDPTRLMLYVPVREGLVKAVRVGDRVQFTVAALGRNFEGEIREIVPAVETGSRTFLVKMCILGDTKGLMPGMFGVIELPLGTEPAYLVPENAITRIGQLEYLTGITADGRQHRLMVRTVPASEAGMRRIVSGVDAPLAIIVPPAPIRK
ncbi:MAG: efflux RND transporter periplasmic adaptor subunit [Victivallales bacterium]|nr:efflux RND transporter periplasmic adaptor subunit [Victivallales bacterium]